MKMVIKSFMHTIAKLLESKGVMVGGSDEMSYTTIKADTENVNESSLGDKTKIVSWPSDMSLDLIRKRLEDLGIWMSDNSLSCKAVVCHRS